MNEPESEPVISLVQRTLQDGRQITLTVSSNSMSPLIRRGDQVIVVALARPLQPGDIITTQTDAGLLTHRFCGYVAGEEPPLLITRGDKPIIFDPPAAAANVLGQVIMVQRHGRWLHLYQGRGRWLNRHLSWLAALDNRILANGRPWQMTNHHPTRWQRRWRQGIHWFLHGWGRLVTAVITLGI